MIAKIIAHGSNRHEALARLQPGAVADHGARARRDHEQVLPPRPPGPARRCATARSTPAWLDRLTAADEHLPTRLADVALVAAALDAASSSRRSIAPRSSSWASRGRPQADTEIGREVELRHGGQSCRVTVRRVGPTRYEVELDGVTTVVEVEPMGRARCRLTIGGRTLHGRVLDPGERPPDRSRRRRPPLLPGRRRHRPSPGGGAGRRRRCRPGRHRGGGQPPGGRRGDEDGDRHLGTGERPGPRRLRRPQRAGRRRHAVVPDRTRRRRRCRRCP